MTLKATFVGLLINTGLAAIKMAAGILGHSHALMADATESIADLFSSVIVWRSLVVAAAPADADHPYGHGKAEPIAAAFISTILFLAAIWIAGHAVIGLAHPHGAPAAFTLVILLFVVAVKESLFRYVFTQGQITDSPAVRSDAWHHRSDAITSLAAGIGITVALAGGPGYEWADDVAALAAAVIIAWNAARLLRPALDELMDATPGLELVEQIRNTAATIEGTERVEKCVVRKIGYDYWVDMHVEVDPQMSVEKAHEIAHQVKDKIRDAIPSVRDVLVHVEPRSARPAADPQSVGP